VPSTRIRAWRGIGRPGSAQAVYKSWSGKHCGNQLCVPIALAVRAAVIGGFAPPFTFAVTRVATVTTTLA
jgi:hypothetical protein